MDGVAADPAGRPGCGAGNPGDASSSFLSGLLLTLADQKAVLFYLGFFPAFFTIESLGIADTLLICALTVCSIGGIKLGYAALAARGGEIFRGGAAHGLRWLAAIMLIGVGLMLILRVVPTVMA